MILEILYLSTDQKALELSPYLFMAALLLLAIISARKESNQEMY